MYEVHPVPGGWIVAFTHNGKYSKDCVEHPIYEHREQAEKVAERFNAEVHRTDEFRFASRPKNRLFD